MAILKQDQVPTVATGERGEMKLIPWKSIEGSAKMASRDGTWMLYEVAVLNKEFPENGSFTNVVWADSAKGARQVMESIFGKGGESRFVLSVEIAKVRISKELWMALKAEQEKEVR